jgi:transcription elongation factor GreA
MEKAYVSREGLEKLKAELAALNERRLVVAAAIEQARGYGDLTDNADYHAAKEEQALLHARIRDLENKVTRAVIMDDQDIDGTKAFLGATVRVLNKKTNQETAYSLVSPLEMDMAHGKVSVQSPLGKALLGHSVGETVVAKVPAGAIEVEILAITR